MRRTEVARGVVSAFSNVNALVVGDIMLDMYTEGTSTRLSPEVPVPVVRGETTRMFLGGAGNVVASLSALGAHVEAFGYIGQDGYGNEVERLLEATHAQFRLIPEGITTVKHRIVCNGQQICRVDWETTSERTASPYDLQILDKMCEDADVIIASDYDKGCITDGVIGVLHRHRHKVVVDPKPLHRDKYKGFRLLTPNEHELFLMSPENDALVSSFKLAKKLHTYVVATLGENGCVYSDGRIAHNVPGRKVPVSNVIGAGDVFVSTLALVLAVQGDGFDPALGCWIANVSAAESVRYPYTHVTSQDELLQLIGTDDE